MGKLCNAGGVKTSGRPNEKALEYEFHHLLWFGSTYKPAQMTPDGAQESRTVTLELKNLKIMHRYWMNLKKKKVKR